MAKEVTFKLNLKVDGKDVVKQLSVDIDELQKAIGDTKSESEKFTASLIKWNQFSELIGNTTSALSQLSSTLGRVTEESRSFGGAMAAANTMAGKSGEEFASLKDQVSELAKTIPIARDELANGLYQVISNGVPEDNWIEYLEKSAKASVGGIADLGETVKVTSTIIKNYGLEWSDAGSIQDKIQLTAKNGVTSFEQLAQALPRVTSNAATLGVSVDELMATFSTLTGVSGNTAEVSTQLAAVFTALVKPSSEASEMAQQMGIQFDAAAIKAAGGMEQFLTSLDQSVKQYAASSGMLEQEIYGKLFGSAESLRALGPLTGQLADKFRENVADMKNSAGTIDDAFSTMASTGGASLQMFKNSVAGVMDALSSMVGKALPYLNIASQVGGSVNAIVNLRQAFIAMGGASRIASASVNAVRSAGVLWQGVSVRMSALTQTVSASFRGAAVSAGTLKLAIQGLMIATGVGLAIAALTSIIEHLTSSSDKAADSVDGLTKAEQQAQQAHQQEAQEIASVRSEMMQNIAKLKDFKGSKEEERKLVQQMNSKYGEAMGYYSTVSQWYQALTANSEAYCNQMINEIRLRTLANQAADLMQQQRDIRYNKDGSLKKYSKRNKTETKTVGQVDAGDGKIIPIKRQVEIKGTSQLDEANRKLTTLHQQETGVRKQMEQIVQENNKITLKHTAGYSPTAPTVTTPSGNGSKTKGGTASAGEKDPVAGSIDWYSKQIEEKRKQLQATANEATAKALNEELEGLQRSLYMLKVRVGVETPDPIEVKKDVKPMAQQIEDAFDDMQDYLKKHPIEVEIDSDKIKKLTRQMKDLEDIKGLSNVDLSSFENVKKALENIRDIANPTAKGFATAGAACQALGSAMQQLGANSAAAKAGMVMAALGQLALSFATAMSDAAKQSWVTWLAFGIAGTAQLLSMVSTISGFATGGIVGGNQTSGDKLLVRVNSGEMILNAAQQARLFALANGAAVQNTTVNTRTLQGTLAGNSEKQSVSLRLRGRDLVGSLANETRSNRRRSNIKI